MPSALSADLRERVVVAIEAGASRRQAARRFEVSPASAVRWHEAFAREGRTRAKPMGGDQRSHAIEAQADLIRQTYEAKPGLFLRELRGHLEIPLPCGNASKIHCTRSLRRQRTTPWAAGIGSLSTIFARARRCSSSSLEELPGAFPLTSEPHWVSWMLQFSRRRSHDEGNPTLISRSPRTCRADGFRPPERAWLAMGGYPVDRHRDRLLGRGVRNWVRQSERDQVQRAGHPHPSVRDRAVPADARARHSPRLRLASSRSAAGSG